MNWWQDRQNRDHFVKKRRQQQWRSRAVFKIEEIFERFPIAPLKGPICDLGSAPGGWAQYLVKKFPQQKIVGCDLLNIDPLKGFDFIQGDFNDLSVAAQLRELAADKKFSVITSDIAPKIDGNRIKEQAFFLELTQNILNFADLNLKDKAYVIQKVFSGEEFEQILYLYRQKAVKVDTFKPKSSRSESREIFIVAKF